MIEGFKQIFAIVIPYTLLCSLLYLYIYWNYFGVQPFEILGFDEVLSYSLPLMTFSMFLLVPSFLMNVAKPIRYKSSGEETQRRDLNKIIAFIGVVNLSVIMISMLGFRINIGVLVGLVCGVSICARLVSDFPILENHFPSTRLGRTFLCLVICCLPVITVLSATILSKGILEGKEFRYILGSDIKNDLEEDKLIYIGQLNNYIFVRRINQPSTIMYKISDLKRVELDKHSNKGKQ